MMIQIIARRAATAAIAVSLALLSVAAPAQHLILHLPLDGSLGHSGRTGEARFVVGDGTAQPIFVPARFGQGLRFDGQAAVAAPFNLDHAEYPVVTVTAWVREEAGARGVREIFSSTASSGIRVGIHGGGLVARIGRHDIRHENGWLNEGEWTFVAATVDTAAGSVRMYVNDVPFVAEGIDTTTSSPPLLPDPADPDSDPQQWVVVGARSFLNNRSTTTRQLLIDDVRVYAGAFDDGQITSLREASTDPANSPETLVDLQSGGGGFSMQSPDAPAGTTAGGSLANSSNAPLACGSHDDCPVGQYCAFERLCHPDSHAPMQDLELVQGNLATLEPPPTYANPDDAPQGRPVPVGSAVTTAVSGEESKITQVLDLGDKFLTRVTWWEQNDRPCGVQIEGSAVSENVITRKFYNCGGIPSDVFGDGYGKVELPTSGMIAGMAGRAVGALRVCSRSNNNRRLKGLGITGDWIGVDGSILGTDLSDIDRLPNCDEWRTTVACGVSQLATGLIVHATRASGRNEQIVGMQLICRNIGLDNG